MNRYTAPVQSFEGAMNIAGRPGIGPKGSNIILVELGDFQSPFSKRLQSGKYDTAIQQDQVVGRSLGIKGTAT